jgi:Zn-dependent M32 family carboxypeptidase
MSNFDPTRAQMVDDPEDEGLFVVMDKLERTLRNHKEQSAKLLGEAADAFQTAVTKSVTEQAIAEMSECVKKMESSMADGDKKSAHFDALKSSLGRVVKVQRETADVVSSNTDLLHGMMKNMEGMEARHAAHMTEMQTMLKQMLEHKPEAAAPVAMPASPKRKYKFTLERDDYGKFKEVYATEL